MYWARSLVLVCLIVTQARCDNGQYGFVALEIEIPCIANPINDICPVDHKVPADIPVGDISKDLREVSALFRSAGGNDSCTEAAKMFGCSMSIKTCKDNLTYYYFDSARAYRQCMTARNACAGVDKELQDEYLDCDEVRHEGDSRTERRKTTCKEYPKLDNDKCPMRNYKFKVVETFNAQFAQFVEYQQTLQTFLRRHHVEENCLNDVFGAFCGYDVQACSKDEEHVVSFLSKQKCFEILRCLNGGINNLFDRVNQHFVSCDDLPDEDTAKKISIYNIYNMTTPSNPKFKTRNTTLTTTTKEISTTCCTASRLSTMGHILVVFIIWLFLGNFAQ